MRREADIISNTAGLGAFFSRPLLALLLRIAIQHEKSTATLPNSSVFFFSCDTNRFVEPMGKEFLDSHLLSDGRSTVILTKK